jgi:hypothetical protein
VKFLEENLLYLKTIAPSFVDKHFQKVRRLLKSSKSAFRGSATKRGKLKCKRKRTLEYSADAGFVHGGAPANAVVLREKINTTLVLQRNFKFKCKNSAYNRVQ